MPPWSYDLIADIYDEDMGGNIGDTDLPFYRSLARTGDRVLEVGCGTGRILLPLAASGLDIVGLDRSLPMLKAARAKAAAGAGVRLVQGDMRRLPFSRAFDLVITPFSVVVYMTQDEDLAAFFRACHAVLRPGGRLAVDAFIPRDVSDWTTPRLDYRRPYQDGHLERRRRILPQGGGVNRIERTYRVLPANGPAREFQTVDLIRPYSAADLTAAAGANGFVLSSVTDDYGRPSTEPRHRTPVYTALPA